jgi:hypothetical protein
MLCLRSVIFCHVGLLYVCVCSSVMLQTSSDGKLQANMLKEVISECSDGKLLMWHLCDILCVQFSTQSLSEISGYLRDAVSVGVFTFH